MEQVIIVPALLIASDPSPSPMFVPVGVHVFVLFFQFFLLCFFLVSLVLELYFVVAKCFCVVVFSCCVCFS